MTAPDGRDAADTPRLMEGAEAIVEAALAAGCRFFAGYPMTPFTEILEHMARRLPEVGGCCINAESELEAVGMVWGALAAGSRAATGSTGQGLSLMQESFAEMTYARLPLVAFNMSRGQSDYFQTTRGGGHGDYRHMVLAPGSVPEAVELTQLAFHLADKWRNPVVVYGDYLLGHTHDAVAVTPRSFPELPEKDWAVDGALNGTGRSRLVTPLGINKHGQEPGDAESHIQALSEHFGEISATETRAESRAVDDAEVVVVAFGTLGTFARYAVRELREEGHRVGFVRPITLWPFPTEELVEACSGARKVAVLENNTGQMIDDVRLSLGKDVPIEFIGNYSTDAAGFGIGALLDTDVIRERILSVIRNQEHPREKERPQA